MFCAFRPLVVSPGYKFATLSRLSPSSPPSLSLYPPTSSSRFYSLLTDTAVFESRLHIPPIISSSSPPGHKRLLSTVSIQLATATKDPILFDRPILANASSASKVHPKAKATLPKVKKIKKVKSDPPAVLASPDKAFKPATAPKVAKAGKKAPKVPLTETPIIKKPTKDAKRPDPTATTPAVDTTTRPIKPKVSFTKPLVTKPPKPARKPRIQPAMAHRQEAHSRHEPVARVRSPPHEVETISAPVRILCDAMKEAGVKRARDKPPVFIAGTIQAAEDAMQLFTEFYKATTVDGVPGPVGFDTETTSSFLPRSTPGVSLIQIATQDVCLLFQVYRITEKNTRRELFPKRLKAFLEDPAQLLVGVAAFGDAVELRSSYNVDCQGIRNLETIAKERRILARSLADLDAMFGQPGREVIKTKQMLRWNWDNAELDSKWIWYAAKDAFAGAAIYENMLNGRIKDGYVPYEKQFPMTEEKQAADIFAFILRALGKGKVTTRGAMESTVSKSYPRFQMIYQPDQRVELSKVYIQKLIDARRLILGSDPTAPANKNDIVTVSGRCFSQLLHTRAGMEVISQYFGNCTLDLETIPVKGISLPSLDNLRKDQDQAMMDLRLFVELAWMWDQSRKMNSMTSIFASELSAVRNRIAFQAEVAKRIALKPSLDIAAIEESIDRSALPKSEFDKKEASNLWQPFLERLRRRGVVKVDQHLWTITPKVENDVLRAVQAMERAEGETLDFAARAVESKLNKKRAIRPVSTLDESSSAKVTKAGDGEMEGSDGETAEGKGYGASEITGSSEAQDSVSPLSSIPEKKPRVSQEDSELCLPLAEVEDVPRQVATV